MRPRGAESPGCQFAACLGLGFSFSHVEVRFYKHSQAALQMPEPSEWFCQSSLACEDVIKATTLVWTKLYRRWSKLGQMPPLGQFECRATMPIGRDGCPACLCCRERGWCKRDPGPGPQILVPSFGGTWRRWLCGHEGAGPAARWQDTT